MALLSKISDIEFDEQVKLAYQSSGDKFAGAVYRRGNVVGTQIEFRKADALIAEDDRAFGTQLVSSNPNFDKVRADLKVSYASVPLDKIERGTTNANVVTSISEDIANAVRRQNDQLCINAMSASSTSNVISDGGTGMTFDKLREIVFYMDENHIPEEDRYVILSAKGNSQLLNETKVTNDDYVQKRAIQNGTFNGMNLMTLKFIVIGGSYKTKDGGLPKTGDIRTCFAWHNRTLGYGVSQDLTGEVFYSGDTLSDRYTAYMYAGAKVIEDAGIIKIDIDETA